MSALSIYKPGQGYYTRLLSAIGAGVLVLAGVAWLWDNFRVWFPNDTVYWQGGMAVAMVAVFGALIYWLLNKPNIAEFMIATEQEMKKVHWPTRRETVGMTIVVIGGMLLLVAVLFGTDVVFGYLFLQAGILEGGAGSAGM